MHFLVDENNIINSQRGINLLKLFFYPNKEKRQKRSILVNYPLNPYYNPDSCKFYCLFYSFLNYLSFKMMAMSLTHAAHSNPFPGLIAGAVAMLDPSSNPRRGGRARDATLEFRGGPEP